MEATICEKCKEEVDEMTKVVLSPCDHVLSAGKTKNKSASRVSAKKVHAKIVRLLWSHQSEPMTLGRLPALYNEAYDETLNYKALGYSKLKSFLETIPLVELKPSGGATLVLLARESERAASADSNESTTHTDLTTIQSRVVQLVSLHSGPLDTCKLPALYKDAYHTSLDHKSLGFSKLKSFLESIQAIKLEKAVTGSILASVSRKKGTATVQMNETKPGTVTATSPRLWQVQSQITLLVSKHSEPVDACHVSALFEEAYHEKLDFRGLGFAKLTHLLEAIPSIEVRKTNGGPPIHLVLCKDKHDHTESFVDSSCHVSRSQSEDGRHPDEQSKDQPTILTLKTKTKRYGCPECGELQNKWGQCLQHIKECCPELLNEKKGLQQRCMFQHKTCIVPRARQDMTATAQPLHVSPDSPPEIPKAFTSFYEWATTREEKSDVEIGNENDMPDSASVPISEDLADDDNGIHAKESDGETENENDIMPDTASVPTSSEDLVSDGNIAESDEKKMGEVSTRSSRLRRVQSRVALLVGQHSTQMDFGRVSSRYQQVFNEKLDFKGLGYSKLKLFLNDIPMVQVRKATKGALVVELRENMTGGVMDGTAHDLRGETLSSDVLKETVENEDESVDMQLGGVRSGGGSVSLSYDATVNDISRDNSQDGIVSAVVESSQEEAGGRVGRPEVELALGNDTASISSGATTNATSLGGSHNELVSATIVEKNEDTGIESAGFANGEVFSSGVVSSVPSTLHAVAAVDLVKLRVRELVFRHSPLDVAKMPELYEVTFHEKLDHYLVVKLNEFLMNIPSVAIGISEDMSTYFAYSTQHVARIRC